jgi:predicted GIY-YIG superfamily endonuclease
VTQTGEAWYVYIVECRDGSLYTGITNDLERRVQEHNEGTASRYTRSRRPVVLRYSEPQPSRSAALIRECAIKLMTPREKRALAAG